MKDAYKSAFEPLLADHSFIGWLYTYVTVCLPLVVISPILSQQPPSVSYRCSGVWIRNLPRESISLPSTGSSATVTTWELSMNSMTKTLLSLCHWEQKWVQINETKTTNIKQFGKSELKVALSFPINFLQKYFKKLAYYIYIIINATYTKECIEFERKHNTTFVFLLSNCRKFLVNVYIQY